MSTIVEDTETCIYLHFSDASPVEEEEISLADGSKVRVLWKDVLVEGEYPMSPGADGRATDTPMRVVAEGESNAATKTISMSDIIASHEDGAFKYVTIPTSHKDGVLDNTGFVPRPKGLRIVKKNDTNVMQAALGFTEPDIAGKVRRGTIPDVSAGIFFNWLNKHTKKVYRAAMKHVALTNTPFKGNLDPFPAIFASDDELDGDMKVEWYSFADDGLDSGNNNDDANKGEIVWDETKAMAWLTRQVSGALRPKIPEDDGRPYQPQPYYYVQDVAPDRALVEEEFKGNTTRFVIPFSVKDDTVEIAPQTRWIEAKQAMIAASDDAPSFESMTFDEILKKVNDVLAKDFAAQGFELSAEKVTLDHRALIKNVKTGSEFVAEFFMSDGVLRIAPTDQWDAVKAPEPKDDVPRPALSAPVVKLDDTSSEGPVDRLRVARKRRRQMVA